MRTDERDGETRGTVRRGTRTRGDRGDQGRVEYIVTPADPVTSNLVNDGRIERDGDTLHPID